MSLSPSAVGIGLRQPHYRELLESRPGVDFLEVHSENFFADDGAALQVLERARTLYPVSLHGVGLSLGSADALENRHLERLARLVARIDPVLVSEHLCWGAIGGEHANDLLPLPYTRATLALMVARVGAVQERLRRPIAIENVSAYLDYRASTYSETAFLAELARQSGCAVLLDVNNLYVNSINLGTPVNFADLSRTPIAEIHLAGHSRIDDCAIDDHGTRVCDAVWQLYREATGLLGAHPTLIEWDSNIPPLATLLDEAGLARAAMQTSEVSHAH